MSQTPMDLKIEEIKSKRNQTKGSNDSSNVSTEGAMDLANKVITVIKSDKSIASGVLVTGGVSLIFGFGIISLAAGGVAYVMTKGDK